MYELWGGGPPFKGSGRESILDKNGVVINLLGASREVLSLLKHDESFSRTKVAWVSCTDEPRWAQALLDQFQTSHGDSIGTVVHSSQIFKANKQEHFRRLRAEFPHLEYRDMLFFDNEMGNIRTVSQLGVKCVYCPHGLTEDAWREGLNMWSTK